MSPTRRYDEDEVAEILRAAAEEADRPAARLARPDGLTLDEIQQIGGEVGIDGARVERAALALDRPVSDDPVRFLGAQRSVSRIVPLERPLDDDEWMRLVVLLRETFGARGKVETLGALRTWYNGNLHVYAEPWEGGHRVRMTTLKGNVTELAIGGAVFLGMAVIFALLIAAKKGLDAGLFIPALFSAAGLGMLGSARLRLPGWAAERTAQMEALAERIPDLLDE